MEGGPGPARREAGEGSGHHAGLGRGVPSPGRWYTGGGGAVGFALSGTSDKVRAFRQPPALPNGCGFPVVDHRQPWDGCEGEKEPPSGPGWKRGDGGACGGCRHLEPVLGWMRAKPGQTSPECGGASVRLPVKTVTLSMCIEYIPRKERVPGANRAIPNP